MKIAFIGLGNMGLPMAQNLLKAGLSVAGYDVSASSLKAFEANGGAATQSVNAAVSEADVVVTMLPSGALVRSVLSGNGGAFEAARPNTLFIDASTIEVAVARELAREAEAHGHMMVDAPVSGGVGGAAAGTLAFMVGGSKAAFERAKAVIEPMAGKIVHTGASGNGQAAKACNNMLLAISMIGVSEAFNLGKALGLDAQVFFDVASNASGQCWSLTSYCPEPGPVPTAPSNNDYKPGFATSLMLKDLGLAMDAVNETGANTPLGSAAHGIYKAMFDEGLGGTDFSNVIRWLKENSGV